MVFESDVRHHTGVHIKYLIKKPCTFKIAWLMLHYWIISSILCQLCNVCTDLKGIVCVCVSVLVAWGIFNWTWLKKQTKSHKLPRDASLLLLSFGYFKPIFSWVLKKKKSHFSCLVCFDFRHHIKHLPPRFFFLLLPTYLWALEDIQIEITSLPTYFWMWYCGTQDST